jgi:hypothetical protein
MLNFQDGEKPYKGGEPELNLNPVHVQHLT